MKSKLSGLSGTITLGECFVVEVGADLPLVRVYLSDEGREVSPESLFSFGEGKEQAFHGTIRDFSSGEGEEQFFFTFDDAFISTFVSIPMNENVNKWLEIARKSKFWVVELAVPLAEIGFLVEGDRIVGMKKRMIA